MTVTRPLSAASSDLRPLDCSDVELVRRFAQDRNEEAFTALVRRHGALVLGVCRRLLRHEQDAEDAFQATFLVLARNARSLQRAGAVGNWLYGVACNVARKAKLMRHRRQIKERLAAAQQPAETPAPVPDDLRDVLDVELHALPDKYRTPIVLCDLRGLTVREAAEEVGCPAKALGTRLSRGRSLLARRLTRRGVAISAAALALGMSQGASAAPPSTLVGQTVRAAIGFAAGSMATVPTTVVALTEGVSNRMAFNTPKYVAILACAVLAVVGLSAGLMRNAVSASPAGPGSGALVQPGQADLFDHVHLFLDHLHAQVGLGPNKTEAEDDKKEDKDAPTGGWVRKGGELKLVFADKDVLRLYPHGDNEVIVFVCSYTAGKAGTLKVKVTDLEGKEEAIEKAKKVIPVGTEFTFRWKVKGDAATIDEVKGDSIDLLKAHLEGDYEKK